MNVTHKDATITNTDETFPGSFQVILSTNAKDRDGDELQPGDWKTPLPEHITFDADHGMSVASTVGSGRPYIDDDGRLVVDGTYSSLDRAQEVRTLVNEGHIRTTSVAFMTEKSAQKDGTTTSVRELLNGAFVAIPSNREALVLASKGIKAGARHSKADADHVQAIHDHALALGAKPAPADDTGAAQGATGGKAFTKSADVLALLEDVDLTTLPEPVQKALALLTEDAEEATTKELDDTDEDETAPEAPAEEKAAADIGVDLKYRALMLTIEAATAAE